MDHGPGPQLQEVRCGNGDCHQKGEEGLAAAVLAAAKVPGDGVLKGTPTAGVSESPPEDTARRKAAATSSSSSWATAWRWASALASTPRALVKRHPVAAHRLSAAAVHTLVGVYLAFAVLHWRRQESGHAVNGLDFNNGLGFLLIVLAVLYLGLLYYAVKPYLGPWLRGAAQKASPRARLGRAAVGAVAAALLVLLLVDIGGDVRRLVSLLGVVVFNVLGLVFSRHPRQVRWRPVLSGLFLQVLMGVLTIRLPQGRLALKCLADKVTALLRCADAGSTFVFSKVLVVDSPVFAFSVLPVVFFFSSLIQVLYYLGAMQWVVSRVGGVLQAVMGTTECESVNAAGSVFLGMTESPLLIKPYIARLTSSELHAVMGTGFATASGSVLAAYISFGADSGHLLTASVMSAMGALAYSKLLLPETEESRTTAEHLAADEAAGEAAEDADKDSSAIDAAARGASAGINIVLNIAANLVAFVSLLHLVNGVVTWLGELVGLQDFSFEMVLAYLFVPVVWLMGVEPAECKSVATLLGLKTVINEFVAFQRMGRMKDDGDLSPRSLAVSTLVLCGFANLGSLAILMSVLSAIAPTARTRVSDVALRSLVAGVVTCCITASIGGMLMTEESFPDLPALSNRTLS
ncbi:hypothetical protein ONE63_004842 [Megalurothrips usitatus]|uniref:Sodium/nucleoside cotransporter n=1 Tax=Megalurothrips usitatus TaxID=439358 RepID=A0AAV7X4U8_9NEOP|nr:hypothetical protein ONE63_004842 [Megalurothrips usitatus]